MPKVCITGGGLAGSLLSILFSKRGYQVDVWERRADMRKGQALFYNTESGKNTKRNYDMYIGADGAFSNARLSLMKMEKLNFTYSQQYLEHGYKELHIPPKEGGGWLLEKECLHIWPRKSF